MANILVCDDDMTSWRQSAFTSNRKDIRFSRRMMARRQLIMLRSQKVDLLIIDIMMLKLDGIRATLKIREENPPDHYSFCEVRRCDKIRD